MSTINLGNIPKHAIEAGFVELCENTINEILDASIEIVRKNLTTPLLENKLTAAMFINIHTNIGMSVLLTMIQHAIKNTTAEKEDVLIMTENLIKDFRSSIHSFYDKRPTKLN